MGRRTTLSAVSPSGINARRASLGVSTRVAQGGGAGGKSQQGGVAGGGGGGGGTAGAGPRRQSLLRTPAPATAGRPSMGGGTRRSSMYGKAGSNGPKSDPRPVTDKHFQQSCVRAIISYLSTHSYESAISPKQLSSPTTKDFLAIVTFLFKQVEPGFKMVAKVEEEVPAMFKRLRYPFPISKTALVAVGSPHSWPPLLAAITWLVELLKYQEKALAQQQQALMSAKQPMGDGSGMPGDREAAGDQEFFEYVSSSYTFFLAGEDEECGAVDDAMEGKFREKEAEAQADVERIRKANEDLQSELDQLTGEPSPRAVLLQRRADFEVDVEKLDKLIVSLGTHKETLSKKIAEREADLAAKRQEMGLIEKESEGIRKRVKAQSISKEDIVRMNTDRSKLQKALDSVAQHREVLDGQVARAELSLEEQLERLEEAAWGYNKAADQLQLIPSSTKRAAGVEFEMAVNRGASDAHDLLSVDLKGVIKPALQRLYDQYAAKRRAASEALLVAREELGVQEEALVERREENAAAEAQVQAAETRHKGVREALESSIAGMNAEAEAARAGISGLLEAAKGRVVDSDERVSAAQSELEAAKSSCKQELEALNDDLTQALHLLIDHKMHVRSVLEQLQDNAQGALDAVSAMETPC